VSGAAGWLLIVFALAASAAFSGSETGLYSLSRVRVDVEARRGRWVSRLVRWLLRNDAALLITLLIGNNLALELVTHQAEHLAATVGVPAAGRELVLLLLLTPGVFLFGEVLPKELFRRRPYTLLGFTAPWVAVMRFAFWPLERVLFALIVLLERALGVEDRALRRFLDREAVLELFRESARGDDAGGGTSSAVADLVHNVTRLRSIRVSDVMVPWPEVVRLGAGKSNEELFAEVCASPYTRLPVEGAAGEVLGYVLQLDVLAKGSGAPVLGEMRALEPLARDTTVARALGRMRVAGLRAVFVGTPERPEGLLTLKDLVEKISGDLADW